MYVIHTRNGQASSLTHDSITRTGRKYKRKFGKQEKIKLSLYRPWRPLGLREVEAPTFSDIRLKDGGKVVSPTRQPLFTPGRFLVLIFVRC
jgi:hypothetical protein